MDVRKTVMDKKRAVKQRFLCVLKLLVFSTLLCPYVYAVDNKFDAGHLYPQVVPGYVDYFQQSRDPKVKQIVFNRERFHMGKKFWDRYYWAIEHKSFGGPLLDLRYVLKWIPNHPFALALMSNISMLSGDYSLSLAYFNNAIRLFPQHASTHAAFGRFLLDINVIDYAIAHLKDATRINPNLAVAYVWLAEAYSLKGQSELAAKATSQARRLGYNDPSPSTKNSKDNQEEPEKSE